MKVFTAVNGNQSFNGNWLSCLHWADNILRHDLTNDGIIKLYVCRPELKTARIVAEVSSNGIRLIKNGRIVSIRSLEALCG